MIRRWVKLLPYWMVMLIVRGINPHVGTFNGKPVYYFQIHEGEIVCFSEEIQKVFNKKKAEKRADSLQKRKGKILNK